MMQPNDDPGERGFLFFNEGDSTGLLRMLDDSILSTIRAVTTIDTARPETTTAYDELANMADARATHVIAVVLDEKTKVTPAVAAIILAVSLSHWSAYAETRGLRDWLDVLEMFCPEARLDSTADGVVVYHAIHSARSLAQLKWLQIVDDPSLDKAAHIDAAIAEAAGALETLADLVQKKDADTALACVQSARNLFRALHLTEAKRLTDKAIEMARSAGNSSFYVAELALRCDILIRIAAGDAMRRCEVFDAFEEAIRAMLAARVRPPTALKILKSWVLMTDYIAPLQAMLALVLPADESRELPLLNQIIADDEAQKFAQAVLDLPAVLSPIWAGTTQDWLNKMQMVRDWSIPLENHRLALEAPAQRPIALVDWASWSFAHPNLRRAVPHRHSILREEHLDEILMVLHHEIAHIFTLLGFVGATLFALRIGQHHLELDLWCRLDKRRSDRTFKKVETDPDEVERARSLAPLSEADVLLLAQAEQTLEVERKIEIFQSCWTPWFEGVAVFGETAADPRMDRHAMAPAIQVVFNLWDTSLAQHAKEHNVSLEEAFRERLTQAEAMYAKALRGEDGNGQAYYRLRQYLQIDANHYLVGYLAVRSVIAAWRATLGRPVSGAELFATLLHVTRFSDGEDAVPDLSLPVEEFRAAVTARHVAWVAGLARIRREDLETIAGSWLKGSTREAMSWSNGRLQVSSYEDSEQTILNRIRTLACEAIHSLRGDRARAERVPDADELLHTILRSIAQALTHKSDEPAFADRQFITHLVSGSVVLPLGQADCPFWLLPETHSLATLIRTRERDKQHGKPSYDVIVFNLSEESFAELRREVEQTGRSRMRVSRIADVFDGGVLPSFGRNFLAFQLGRWLHLQNRGASMGSEEFPDGFRERAESRLAPSTLVSNHQWLTGDAHPAAKRTLAWVQANDWNVEVEGLAMDVTPWARRVAGLAEQIIADDGAEDVRFAAAALMQALFGPPDAAQQLYAALTKLRDESSSQFRDLIRLFETTGYQPEGELPAAESVNQFLQDLGTPLFARYPYGWDVVCPGSVFTGVR